MSNTDELIWHLKVLKHSFLLQLYYYIPFRLQVVSLYFNTDRFLSVLHQITATALRKTSTLQTLIHDTVSSDLITPRFIL